MPAPSLSLPHPDLLTGIPGDPGLPVLGNTLQVMRNPTSLLLRLYETHARWHGRASSASTPSR